MKNFKTYLLILFVLPLFYSCTKDATGIKLPETDPKLVVGCFISPDDPEIIATVAQSNPIFGSGHNNKNTITLPEAEVKISDGVNTATLPYDDVTERFRISTSALPIVAGKTYTINVTAPNVKNSAVSS